MSGRSCRWPAKRRHERAGIGGVTPERNDLFKSAPNVDLGDEGRIPPRLTAVGSKLLPEALVRILFKGELRVRPYYQTRMPIFRQETLADLPEMLARADAANDTGVSPAQVVPGNERFGRQLVGVRGLGCVNCHGVKGAKSLGVPGPDLATVRDRLRPQYFARWLADPAKLVPGTRMPSFWTEGESSLKDVLAGRFDRQCDAIWSYLQQGPDMPLPEGLRIDGIDELVPSDEVIVLRAFVTGVGPRAILVGNPDGLHWVFDANSVRLAKAWHGKFFDAAGSWEQRGGAARAPLGKDVLDMPPGPSFAVLDSQGAAWPHPIGIYDRNAGGQFRGYTLDKSGRPTFHYFLHGVDIHESAEPKGVGRKATLLRHFTLAATSAPKDLFFLLAAGKKIERRGTGEWRIDDKLAVRLTADQGTALPSTEIRDGEGGTKLLVLPVTFERDAATFTVEMSW